MIFRIFLRNYYKRQEFSFNLVIKYLLSALGIALGAETQQRTDIIPALRLHFSWGTNNKQGAQYVRLQYEMLWKTVGVAEGDVDAKPFE